MSKNYSIKDGNSNFLRLRLSKCNVEKIKANSTLLGMHKNMYLAHLIILQHKCSSNALILKHIENISGTQHKYRITTHVKNLLNQQADFPPGNKTQYLLNLIYLDSN